MDLQENRTGTGKSVKAGAPGKPTFLQGSLPLILAWPIVCAILAVLLWFSMLSKLDADRIEVEQHALKEVSSLANAYEQNLALAIEQIDQVTLLLKYEWEQSHRTLKLEDFRQKGIFPSPHFAFVTVIDRDGNIITGTLPAGGQQQNVADRAYFRFHAADRSQALRIGEPTTGRVSGKNVIQFTRRLETKDGSFGGVILISIEPASFFSFYDASRLGKAGLLAILGPDRALRIATIGGATWDMAKPALLTIPPLDKPEGVGPLQGRQWFGDTFADKQTRFVAAKSLKTYPLIALVGLAAEERIAPYRETWQIYRNIAIAGCVFLLLFALAATLLAARLAWRKHSEAEVRNAYRIATEGGNDGFYMLRPLYDKNGMADDFVVVDCNERGAAFSGIPTAQFIGSKLSALYPKPYFYVERDTLRAALESGFYEDELKIPPESPLRVEWVYRRLVRSGAALALTMRDISATKAHERDLRRMANEDALTALPNRNWMMSFLPEEIERARDADAMMALLFVDLDDFKDINDSLGHSVGDELLRAAALRLKSVLRPTDHVVRLGGDEFTVILSALESQDAAAHVAERIAEKLNFPFDLARGKNTLGASIGISIFPRDGQDAETLLKHSDIAMYHAKSEGKGHYRFYEQSLSESLNARLDNELALQQAIEQDQFVLFYQPRVNTFTGELQTMEALVRWKHPQRGLVPPLEFIPLAEETGLILKLGELVVEQVCAQIAHWKALGIPLVPISVNVSPRQFYHGDIANLFASSIARHHIDADLVEIEITESSMMGKEEGVVAELAAIRNLGIKLLVDDFGTGYSSLSQLQRLDMDVLKVDRAFTAELGATAEGEVFFRAIVSMAHALGMIVVAEGVESSEQMRVLQSLSCDEIQGYFISRPVPTHEAQALMVQRFLMPLQPIKSVPCG